MAIDAYVPYTEPPPTNPTAADVLAAAQNYVNASSQWAADNCTGLVWAVAYAVGVPFYESVSDVAADAGEPISQIVGSSGIIPDNGYDVPVKSVDGTDFDLSDAAALSAVYAAPDTLGSSWQLVNGGACTNWFSVIGNNSPDDEPQPGDLFRGVAVDAGKQQCVMHSGVVQSYNPSTHVLTLISNWRAPVTGVVGVDSFTLIDDPSQAIPSKGPYIFENKSAFYRLESATTAATGPGTTFSVSSASGDEGTTLVFYVTINNANYPLTSDYRLYCVTSDGTAIAGHDYTAVNSAIDFKQNIEQTVAITVATQDVTAVDGTKSFTLNLYDNNHNLLTSATGTIFDTAPSGPLTVESGELITVASDQTDTAYTIQEGGTLVVANGGLVKDTIDNGTEVISAGGTDIGATINHWQIVFGTAEDTVVEENQVQFVSSGGTAIGTTVLSGGLQQVSSAGRAIGTMVNSGGAEEILSGGTASGATISSFGNEFLFSGGTTTGSIVGPDGLQYVYAGGNAVETTVSGGSEYLSGGTAVGTLVEAGAGQGGDQFVSSGATASNTTVTSGGIEEVLSAGLAIATVIAEGGVEELLSGGTASNTTIAGGVFDLANGATAAGAINFTEGVVGGTLQIDASTMPMNTISGFGAGDAIDLTAVAGGAEGAVDLTTSGTQNNILAVTEGAQTYKLQLDPSQNFAGETFHLSRAAGGVGTEITVTGGPTGNVFEGTYTNTIVLNTPAVQNPATIASTASVDVNNTVAVSGTAGFPWAISNFGTIQATGASYNNTYGILLTAGGTVTNGQAGVTNPMIGGADDGVSIHGADGLVANFGNINGSGFAGIELQQGGAVVNGQVASTAALISGYVIGIQVSQSPGTITNFGTIEDTVTYGLFGKAVVLSQGGFVSNQGLIETTIGASIYASHAAVTLANSGTIEDLGPGTGVDLLHGGLVTNNQGGLIQALGSGGVGIYLGGIGGATASISDLGTISAPQYIGVEFRPQQGTASLTNGQSGSTAGVIEGGRTGVLLDTSNLYPGISITNFGTIEGGTGLISYSGNDAVTDFGTIIGIAGTAIAFGSGNNRLIVKPGAAFVGNVDGGGGTNTIELAAGSNSGALYGLGTSFSSFQEVVVDPGASWQLSGIGTSQPSFVNDGTIGAVGGELTLGPVTADSSQFGVIDAQNSALLEFQGGVAPSQTVVLADSSEWLQLDDPATFGGVISGFIPGDVMDLPNLAFGSGGGVTVGANNLLEISLGADTYNLQLSSAQNLTGYFFHLADDGSGQHGTEITEDQTACYSRGTLVLTDRGEVAVERLSIRDLVLTPDGDAEPIVWIGTGRALVTPGRRSAATPVIIRKGALADNVPHRDLRVTKGHSLYLDGVLIPVEFLVNHRSIIWDDHAREIEIYHIELAQHGVLIANGAPTESYRDDGNRWLFQNANSGWNLPPQTPCAPILTGGPVVDAIWRRLLDRAGPRPGLPLTDDPDLHVLVDRTRIDGHRTDVGIIFALPQCSHDVHLVSRAARPDELGLARDPRPLGVAIWQIQLWRGRHLTVVEADDERLVDGFHQYEAACGHRWTSGDALLPAALFDGFSGPVKLEVLLGGKTQYVLETPALAA